MTIAELGAILLWAFASALFGGLLAVALNRWAVGWSLVTRALVAVSASISPTFGIVVVGFAALGPISLWLSPDEFLIPFALQVFLILVFAAPIVWLISRRAARKPAVKEVFD
jgi:sensor histidine kinase regulating citrate/malate metabolism